MRIVRLQFFEDDANGEYGVAPAGTQDDNEGNGFNAFWDGIGIFHDVFEHWFEGEHKYFRGDNYRNVAGEIAATGAALYFNQEMYLANRVALYSRDRTAYESLNNKDLIGNTQSMIEDAILSGYLRYGDTFQSGIPFQRTSDNENVEELIRAHWKEIQFLQLGGIHASISEEQSREFSERYKNSITLEKLRNAYRWGYKQASTKIPNNYHNRHELENFIQFFHEFTKRYKAKDLYEDFHTLEIRLHTGENVRWSAKLITRNGQERVSLDRIEEYLNKTYDYE